MVYLAAVGLAIFLSLLVISKSGKTHADWLLALWLLVIALHMLAFALIRMKLYLSFLGLDMPLPLLHGPCLYLYTRALTGRAVKAKHLLLHFALPLILLLYLIPFIFSPTSEKIYVYEHGGIGYEKFLLVRAVCIPLSGVVYVFMSMVTLRRHRKTIAEHFSSVQKVNLAWLQFLILWLAVIWAFVIFAGDNWVFGAAVAFIFFIGFFGIRQGVIFSPDTIAIIESEENKEQPLTEAVTEVERSKYQKSGLTHEGSALLHQKLGEVMRTEQLFKDSELTLLSLATRVNAPPNHLSQVINEREGKSFYDYINGLRVQEFLKIVAHPDSRKLTLFAVAQECGFNSKSSFNRYFKKFTGRSPSEYVEGTLTIQN